MRELIKKIYSALCSFFCLRKIRHGKNCKCNFPCHFSRNMTIGDNCHFNGFSVSGEGKITIGNNFHSGKHIRVLTSFHNWKDGDALPYDTTYVHKDVVIGDNVWLGESVMILGGGPSEKAPSSRREAWCAATCRRSPLPADIPPHRSNSAIRKNTTG